MAAAADDVLDGGPLRVRASTAITSLKRKQIRTQAFWASGRSGLSLISRDDSSLRDSINYSGLCLQDEIQTELEACVEIRG